MANPCVHRDMCPNLCPCDYFEPVEQAEDSEQWDSAEETLTEKKS